MPTIPRQGRKGGKVSSSPAMAGGIHTPLIISPATLPPGLSKITAHPPGFSDGGAEFVLSLNALLDSKRASSNANTANKAAEFDAAAAINSVQMEADLCNDHTKSGRTSVNGNTMNELNNNNNNKIYYNHIVIDENIKGEHSNAGDTAATKTDEMRNDNETPNVDDFVHINTAQNNENNVANTHDVDIKEKTNINHSNESASDSKEVFVSDIIKSSSATHIKVASSNSNSNSSSSNNNNNTLSSTSQHKSTPTPSQIAPTSTPTPTPSAPLL